MICAYSKCGKSFDPSRRGQIYHRDKCRERAKAERVVLVKVPREQAGRVKQMLARLRAKPRGVTPLPGIGYPISSRQRCGSKEGSKSDWAVVGHL
jgi:hypothetical protein